MSEAEGKIGVEVGFGVAVLLTASVKPPLTDRAHLFARLDYLHVKLDRADSWVFHITPDVHTVVTPTHTVCPFTKDLVMEQLFMTPDRDTGMGKLF